MVCLWALASTSSSLTRRCRLSIRLAEEGGDVGCGGGEVLAVVVSQGEGQVEVVALQEIDDCSQYKYQYQYLTKYLL